jgi:hypothetical protein
MENKHSNTYFPLVVSLFLVSKEKKRKKKKKTS